MGDYNDDHLKLPEDSLTEIFIRSSVQSLLCAKCVCKKWYTLIQNPQFILDHHQYQKSHDKGRLFFQYFKEDTEEYKYVLFDDETLVHVTYHDIDYFHFPFEQYDIDSLHMEGPINGLYCLYNREDRIIMWNPALKDFKALPSPHPYFLPHGVQNCHGTVAFGIDPSTNDYKVILTRKFKHRLRDLPFTYLTVYNLTTNIWRLRLNCPLPRSEFFRQSRISTFINGIYYWWTEWDRFFAFDMGEETFREIVGPDFSDHPIPIRGSLSLYNDKITLVFEKRFSTDILMMLEEGLWIKQFSVTSLPDLNWEVGLWKNNGFLVAIDGYDTPEINSNFQTVLCYANTKERINVGPKGDPKYFQASIYYESLVPVNLGIRHKSKWRSLSMITNFLEPTDNSYNY